jgi:hypothetical protein
MSFIKKMVRSLPYTALALTAISCSQPESVASSRGRGGNSSVRARDVRRSIGDAPA